MRGFILEILQILMLVTAAPIFAGWIKMVKCRMQGRTSPGIFQPYRDMAKLFSKDIVLAENASWIFRFTPYLVFGTAIIAGAVVPMISTDLPLSPTADAIVLIGLFSIARFFTALAAMDIGTAFGGMGSSREMMVASLAEPAMLMVIFTVSLLCGSTSLSSIAVTISSVGFAAKPSLAFAFFAFILIALAENGRIPVDNPATHLELTMLHEAMILEYSGRHLALIEWAGMMKHLLFMAIGSALFLPLGISTASSSIAYIPVSLGILFLKLAAAAVVLVIIETGLAKMRLFRLTEFLGSAFLMATLGMLSFFILE
jgi:formate hydrogenlyase subunit 4